MSSFCCLNRRSARVGRQEFLFFGYILFCTFPVIGRAFGLYFPLAAVLSVRASPLVAVLSDCTSPWRLCFRIVLSRCQIYFQTAPHNKTCWWKAKSRKFVFLPLENPLENPLESRILRRDLYARFYGRKPRPSQYTCIQALLFQYTHQYARIAQANRNNRTIIVQFTMQLLRQVSHAQSVAKAQALCKHRTLNVPPKRKHRASIVRSICRQSANTAQVSHAQCAAKVQALCKHRTPNLSPKRKHCANNALFADFSAPFPCRICLFIQVLALGVVKTAKFYRFFTAIDFDAAGASPPVLS